MKYTHLIVLQYAYLLTDSFVIKPNNHASFIQKSIKKETKLKSISSKWLSLFNKKTIEKDVVVIGGGISGLSIALELTLKHDKKVTILEKSSIDKQGKNGSGSFAAAGMLAPQSERLPLGPLLDICYASREMYSDFVDVVEELASKGKKEYLYKGEEGCGYRSKGGFIAPAFAGDSVSSWAPPEGYGNAMWLDDIQVKSLEPELHPDVIGGWWFPEDTSVDARRLTCSLAAACDALGVDMCFGDEYAVQSLDLNHGECKGVRTANGSIYKGGKVVVANGSWMRDLVPVPIIPHKGQSMSLTPPNHKANDPPLLNRVLFAQDTYIVPKSDGRIIIGATVEPGSFDTSVTSSGVMHVITAATGLIPALRNYNIDEMWAGFRPTTPDKAPILGKTPWENLIIAGGYWRNGILLAPKTSQLIADLATDNLSLEDTTLLDAFAWDRFLSSGDEASTKLALQSKYASSVHPLQYHSDSSNTIVGTELGFYSDATVAKEERKKERNSMFTVDDQDLLDTFEKAALAGKKDGSAFVYRDESTPSKKKDDHDSVLQKISQIEATTGEDESVESQESEPSIVDQLTLSTDDNSNKSMDELYQTIVKNKASKDYQTESTVSDNEPKKKEFHFKIYHVDKQTGEKILVPPGTKPEAFERMLAAKKGHIQTPGEKTFDAAVHDDNTFVQQMAAADEKTYDGYVTLQDGDFDMRTWKNARMQNRFDSVNDGQVGAEREEDDNKEVSSSVDANSESDKDTEASSSVVEDSQNDKERSKDKSMEDLYQTIQENKAKASQAHPIVETDSTTSEAPKKEFNFKIFRMDPKTGEKILVPPGTKPEVFERMLAAKNGQEDATPTPPGEKTFDAAVHEDNTFVQRMIAAEQKGKELKETTPDEKTYDGYVTLEDGDFDMSTWKNSRQQNRFDFVNNDEVGAELEH